MALLTGLVAILQKFFFPMEVSRKTIRLKLKKQRISFRKSKGRMKNPVYKEKKEMLGMLRDICKTGDIVFIYESKKALKEYAHH